MNAGFVWLYRLCTSFVLAMPAGATEGAGTFTPACAERDLKVITFIEQQGDAAGLPPAVLSEAGLAHMQARLDCLAGREADALAIYDGILRAGVVTFQAKK